MITFSSEHSALLFFALVFLLHLLKKRFLLFFLLSRFLLFFFSSLLIHLSLAFNFLQTCFIRISLLLFFFRKHFLRFHFLFDFLSLFSGSSLRFCLLLIISIFHCHHCLLFYLLGSLFLFSTVTVLLLFRFSVLLLFVFGLILLILFLKDDVQVKFLFLF